MNDANKSRAMTMQMAFAVALLSSLPSFGDEMFKRDYPELPERLTAETPEERSARMEWWTDARFGMFIHFGLYSVAAGVGEHGSTDLGEWIKSRQHYTNEEYDGKFLPRFNPDLFDAREWARTARRAGMKYVVLTAKHHEGFCLWDTKTTDYKITKTAFGRDIVREYVEALRAEGLRVGLYFSIIDWHHPDFTIDQTHPLRPSDKREWTAERAAELNKGRDMGRYRAYMFEQARELLTEYGTIDIFWFDYTARNDENPAWGKTYRDWDAVELLKMARRLQPGVIIDNRLDLMDTEDGWDFLTPEQCKAGSWPTHRGKRAPWETCQTFSGSWGYCRDQDNWKSVPQLLALLSETVSKGGNLIMNVGPTARGTFDARALERLDGFSRWMRLNSRSIYGCTEPPRELVAPSGTAVTYNPKTGLAYIHLYEYPMGRLPVSWWDRIEYAQFLHDGSRILVANPPKPHLQSGDTHGTGGLMLPVRKPAVDVPVIETWLKK